MGLARQGWLVLLYSDGVMESKDEDGLYYRKLDSIERILAWVQPDWDVRDVAAFMDQDWVVLRQRVFCALAILARCVVAESGLPASTRKRRDRWRTDREKWARVLADLPLPALRESARREGKPEAEKLLSWILGGEDAFDFQTAAAESSRLA